MMQGCHNDTHQRQSLGSCWHRPTCPAGRGEDCLHHHCLAGGGQMSCRVAQNRPRASERVGMMLTWCRCVRCRVMVRVIIIHHSSSGSLFVSTSLDLPSSTRPKSRDERRFAFLSRTPAAISLSSYVVSQLCNTRRSKVASSAGQSSRGYCGPQPHPPASAWTRFMLLSSSLPPG